MAKNETAEMETRTAGETRALVALAAAAATAVPRPRPRQAPFLAQLIATKQQLPQTRERRRADPAQAVTAYRTMAELVKWS